MGTGPISTDWIYESPDGGVTVYRRQLGSHERELITVMPATGRWALADRKNLAVRRMRWYRMLDDALNDPTLDEMIDRVEVWWILKHEGKDGT